MLRSFYAMLFCAGLSLPAAQAQPDTLAVHSGMTKAARSFLGTLQPEQKKQATYPFEDAERLVWYFVPHERKGLPLKQMTTPQQQAALALLRTALSQQGYDKAAGIMDTENVLRVIDNRPPNDTYRDPVNYYVTIFGDPASANPWGWRFEGHHLSVQFVVVTDANGKEKALSYTPLFFGANPAVLQFDSSMADKRMADPRVKDLPQRGRQLLRREAEQAFALLSALSADQRKQAVLDPIAYPDIITGNKRSASLEKIEGLPLTSMTASQRRMFLDLLQTYLTNYRITLAKQQMDKLEKTGLDNFRFAWAGDLTPKLGEGKGWYYRIHGPTLLIEYDNTQNNANHVHTVVRDLTNDFGDDLLQEHYRASKHSKP